MKRLLWKLVTAALLAVLSSAGFANTASAGRAVNPDVREPPMTKRVDPPAARPQVHGANCRCAVCARIRPPIVIPGSRFYYVPPQLWGPLGPPPGYYGNNYGRSSYNYRYQCLPGVGIGFGPGAIFNW